MSHPSPLAKLALRHLADAEPDIAPPTRDEADAAVDAIARELDATRRRRNRRHVIVAALALAAGALLVLGSMRVLVPSRDGATVSDLSGGVLLVRGQRGANLTRGEDIAKGDRLVASAAGRATLAFGRGSELVANEGADVVIVEHGKTEIFELRAGSVDLHVAKLESGERLIVRTSDADVEVRGTRFRVDAGQRCIGTSTRVTVTEGVVVVRQAGAETRVMAGASWPSDCGTATTAPVVLPTTVPTATATAAPSAVVTPTAMATLPARPVTTTSSTASAPSALASSELAEQNRLYAEAMAAKRRGDPATALVELDRLLASHPHGPLAESASVERMRIIAVTDPPRAAEAARAYLARHPNGYAREEARRLAGAP